MDAITLLTEGTMRAAVHMVNHTGKFPKLRGESHVNLDRYCTLVSGALRQTLRASILDIKKEWKDAIDAHMTESMLKTVVNTQCNYYALQALKMVEKEL